MNALRSWTRERWRATAHPPLEGPRVSIREAGRENWSMFQEMDINRYITTVEDRLLPGALAVTHRTALSRSWAFRNSSP